MKRLLLAIMLFPVSAISEVIPPGCYVADYYRTDPCWEASDNYYNWTAFSNRQYGTDYYGETVEVIIHEEFLSSTALSDSIDDYNSLAIQYNAKLDKLSACESSLSATTLANEFHAANTASANANLAKANSLVKKLRKACGTKCKKIK